MLMHLLRRKSYEEPPEYPIKEPVKLGRLNWAHDGWIPAKCIHCGRALYWWRQMYYEGVTPPPKREGHEVNCPNARHGQRHSANGSGARREIGTD